MVAASASRPSLKQGLSGAVARLEGDILVLEVLPDFLTLVRTHMDEYQELAKKALGRVTKIRIEGAPQAAEPPPSTPEDVGKDRLSREAKAETAVQEVLDLFDGTVVDVREAKPVKESV